MNHPLTVGYRESLVFDETIPAPQADPEVFARVRSQVGMDLRDTSPLDVVMFQKDGRIERQSWLVVAKDMKTTKLFNMNTGELSDFPDDTRVAEYSRLELEHK